MTFLTRLFRSRSLENPAVPLTDSAALAAMFDSGSFGGGDALPEVAVTVDTALGVPAIWSAVNFLSNTLAALPLHVLDTSGDNPQRSSGPLADLLHDSPCEGWTSFKWRKYAWTQVFTGGRFVAFIEKNPAGRILNLWPLEPDNLTVERRGGVMRYIYRDGGRMVVYAADEVIDLTFMLRPDQVGHRSPILSERQAIRQIIAIENYAAKFFANGGIPQLVLQGTMNTPSGIKRASEDVWDAVRSANARRQPVLTMPLGHELKAVGIDPSKGQMIEARRFGIGQVARIYSLPPVFVQDLERATFTNSEQQDLHLVKHTIAHWARQFEDEVNLKLFGRTGRTNAARLSLDGLLRGDFTTRMTGHAQAIQNGISTPNEARALEKRPALPGGEGLLIQGATVPLVGHGEKEGSDDAANNQDT